MAAMWKRALRGGGGAGGAPTACASAAGAAEGSGSEMRVMRCTSRSVRWCSASALCSAALREGSTSMSIISVKSLPS
jgi:hypothetical protein